MSDQRSLPMIDPTGAEAGGGPSDGIDSGIERRDALRLIAAIGAAAALGLGRADIADAAGRAAAALETAGTQGTPYKPKIFTPDEWREVRALVDLVIPRDARSGGATDAGVPEFMDFILQEYPGNRTWMREYLSWMNAEARRRFSHGIQSCTDAERRAILDDIAWPRKTRAELKPGVDLFNRFRDFTASGFFSSKVGVKDLQYLGNVALGAWPGCPPAALARIGVSYETIPRRAEPH